jgi:ribonuclease E
MLRSRAHATRACSSASGPRCLRLTTKHRAPTRRLARATPKPIETPPIRERSGVQDRAQDAASRVTRTKATRANADHAIAAALVRAPRHQTARRQATLGRTQSRTQTQSQAGDEDENTGRRSARGRGRRGGTDAQARTQRNGNSQSAADNDQSRTQKEPKRQDANREHGVETTGEQTTNTRGTALMTREDKLPMAVEPGAASNAHDAADADAKGNLTGDAPTEARQSQNTRSTQGRNGGRQNRGPSRHDQGSDAPATTDSAKTGTAEQAADLGAGEVGASAPEGEGQGAAGEEAPSRSRSSRRRRGGRRRRGSGQNAAEADLKESGAGSETDRQTGDQTSNAAIGDQSAVTQGEQGPVSTTSAVVPSSRAEPSSAPPPSAATPVTESTVAQSTGTPAQSSKPETGPGAEFGAGLANGSDQATPRPETAAIRAKPDFMPDSMPDSMMPESQPDSAAKSAPKPSAVAVSESDATPGSAQPKTPDTAQAQASLDGPSDARQVDPQPASAIDAGSDSASRKRAVSRSQ